MSIGSEPEQIRSAADIYLGDLPKRYRVILCDLWGCIHDGVAAFPESLAVMRAWRSQGRMVLLLTNAPRPSSEVQAQLDRLSVDRGCYDAIVSSGDAGLAYLASFGSDQTYGFIGSSTDRTALEETGVRISNDTDLAAVICTGFAEDHQNDLGYYMAELELLLKRGVRMLCFNPDEVVVRGGIPELCAGAIARRYVELGGTVSYFGKPNRPIYDRAMAVAGAMTGCTVDANAVLAVGDSVRTDLLGAAASGLDFLFVSGGIEADEFANLGQRAFMSRVAAEHRLRKWPVIGCVDKLTLESD